MAYVYILECRDGTLYTGITTDIKRRFAEHIARDGVGAKYTRAHPPKRIAALWECDSMKHAARIEWVIKQLPRQKKLTLIDSPMLLGSESLPLPSGITCSACLQNAE